MINFISKNKKQIAGGALLLVLFFAGLYLRSVRTGDYIPFHTVVSYYYDKSNRLNETGQFPRSDIWDFAPDTRIDNAPPGLAYATVFLYRIIGQNRDFYDFAQTFPVVMYAIWFFVLIFCFRKLFEPAVVFWSAAIFALLPVSVAFTTHGRYLEETLGTVLIFIFIYAFIRLSEEPRTSWYSPNAALLFFVSAALALTWQQYVVPIGAAGLILATRIAIERRKVLSRSLLSGAMLLGGVLFADAYCRIASLGYSPLEMAWEFIYAMLNVNNPDIVAAMRRTDWANPDISDLHAYFGSFGAIMGFLGAAAILLDIKNGRKQAIGIFSAVGFITMASFEKNRFLAMTVFLYLFALGIELFLHPHIALEIIRSFFRSKYVQKILSLAKNNKKAITAAVLLACTGVAVFAIFSDSILLALRYRTPPVPAITVTSKESAMRVGGSYPVTVTLTNKGGRPLSEESTFGGLHIEVKNAYVKNVRAVSRFTSSEVAFKNYSWAGNLFFFETKYPRLGPGESGRATFTLEPYDEPITIYYRGWLPGFCTKEKRHEALVSLLPGWQEDDKGGWRNESCIERAPEMAAEGTIICQIPVMAAHQELQDFECYEKRF